MEIRIKGTALPCVAQEDITAGLAVLLVSASGKSSPDVTIGAKLPLSSAEAARAYYVAEFAVSNTKPPIYESLPTLSTTGGQPYALREFPEGSENLPSSVTLRMVDPRLKVEQTIPSGSLMLAYDEGVYTVTSGCFVDSASLIPGAEVEVVATGSNRGKWQLKSAGTKVATVLERDSTNVELTFRTIGG